MKTSCSTFIFLIICFLSLFSQENTYRNPVIPGDFPDPSVIRVGEMYYAAGTSSEWGPPYRLFESKDLVNWHDLVSLFREMPDWTMGSYWAPELFYRNGTYFVYYTARRKSDRKSFIGVATTQDIRQGFKDHGLIIEWTNEAIDAFVFESEGQWYITWKAYGLDEGKEIEILCSELSDDGLRLKGDVFSLIKADRNSWEAGGIEGQCLVKHDDYIYMFYAGNACCGRDCNYQTGVARSKSIRGPWEKYVNNPILHGDDHWRCPGHGTLVETAGHRFFYLYHAYNASTDVYTGREGMIDEIIWDKASGWPAFRYGRTPSLQAASPHEGAVQEILTEFKTGDIQWIWNVGQEKPKMEVSGDGLVLEGTDAPTGAFLGFRILQGDYTLQTTIESRDVSAGICLYGSQDQAAGLSFSGNEIELWQVNKGLRTVLVSKSLLQTRDVTLSVRTRFGQYCQFGYTSTDGSYQKIGEPVHIHQLLQWDRPPIVGIQAKGRGKATFQTVDVRYY